MIIILIKTVSRLLITIPHTTTKQNNKNIYNHMDLTLDKMFQILLHQKQKMLRVMYKILF